MCLFDPGWPLYYKAMRYTQPVRRITSPACQTTQKTGRLVRSSRFYTIAGRGAYVASTSVSRTTSNMGGSTRMASIS